MNVYSSMLPTEFIAGIRDALIQAKASSLVLNQLDALQDMTTLPAELEKRDEELNQMERDRDDLRDELLALLCAFPVPVSDTVRSQADAAFAALERHSATPRQLDRVRTALDI